MIKKHYRFMALSLLLFFCLLQLPVKAETENNTNFIEDIINEGSNNQTDNATNNTTNNNTVVEEDNTIRYGSLVVEVTDSSSGAGLANVGIQITNGSYTTSRLTDASGRIEFTNLTPGMYQISVTSAPLNYNVPDPISKNVVTRYSVTAKLQMKQNLSSLTIKASDMKYNDGLTGVQFKVTGPNSYSRTIETYDGTVSLSDLSNGTYTVSLVKGPEGYDLPEEKEESIDVVLGQTNELEFSLIPLSKISIRYNSATSEDDSIDTFVITGPDDYKNTVTIKNHEGVEVKDLSIGEYTIVHKSGAEEIETLTKSVGIGTSIPFYFSDVQEVVKLDKIEQILEDSGSLGVFISFGVIALVAMGLIGFFVVRPIIKDIKAAKNGELDDEELDEEELDDYETEELI